MIRMATRFLPLHFNEIFLELALASVKVNAKNYFSLNFFKTVGIRGYFYWVSGWNFLFSKLFIKLNKMNF
jgi:hypothetical protein